MNMTIDLREVSPREPSVLAMIQSLDAFCLSLYSAEACHFDSPEVLIQSNCSMIGAYVGSKLAGIGALKHLGEYGEIKRMYVAPEFRGKGISKRILDRLLSIAATQKLTLVRLETGPKLHSAIALYTKTGFTVCAPFGSYQASPDSLCMEKVLPPRGAVSS